MPHQIIEYSANLEADMDVEALVSAMHDTAIGIDALPMAGIRTRAIRHDHYKIADGHEDNAYIYVTLRIMAGRSTETRKDAGERLFSTLREFIEPVLKQRPILLSFEIQEIDPEARWKHSNIRDYLAERAR
jgi:5-carboxymethyl-2-hydroxymuconate isomerase